MEMIILIALIVGAISFTITTTSIFLWLREIVSKWHHKIEELIHCPWCLSHYIAILVLWITGYRVLFVNQPIIDFILTLFAVVAINGLFHYIILRAYEPVAKSMLMRRQQQMRNVKTTQHEED